VPFEYTFGIEEEYFLSSMQSGNLASRVPKRLLTATRAQLGDSVTTELLQSQIEIASPVFHSHEHAREGMVDLRSKLARVVGEFGVRLIASSTHPFGVWREQQTTDKPRYDQLIADFRIIGQRNLICGMHVHAAVPPHVDRIDLMNRLMPWLPLFLALSTSSPFWRRQVTGLLSYRQALYDEWPRSGIPDYFNDQADYDAFVEVLTKGESVKDASYLWWAVRPALRFPTLEMRIADVCTRLEDALTLASLYRCLIATLVEQPDLGRARTTHTRRIIDENRWRAKRDGTQARFIEEPDGTLVTVPELLQRLCSLIAPAMQKLQCEQLPAAASRIIEGGTSAHAQLRIYNESRASGALPRKSLHSVVDWLAATTAAIPA
jgi:carboxylate-amine ligase